MLLNRLSCDWWTLFALYTVDCGCRSRPDPIVEYCWYFDWTGDPSQDMFPDCGNSQPLVNFPNEPGAWDVRLRVEDNTGARAAIVQTFFFEP